MITFPHARITLGLHVTNKRTDGFHDIETLMVPIRLFDALEAVHAHDGTMRFSMSGLTIPDYGHPNLCLQACAALNDHLQAGCRNEANRSLPPLHIHLRKSIPAGAGLAGGSADAAFMLQLLNQLLKLHLNIQDLVGLANKLGSDCPFFLHSTPMIATGRGNMLTKYDLPGSFYEHHLVIVVPPVHISTKDAYSSIKPKKPKQPLIELLQKPVNRWQDMLSNDFEEAIFTQHPTIAAIKTRLLSHGAVFSSLSGSGSAIYALFKEAPVLSQLHAIFPGCFVHMPVH